MSYTIQDFDLKIKYTKIFVSLEELKSCKILKDELRKIDEKKKWFFKDKL